MSQLGITEPVTDGDTNSTASQSRHQDAPVDGESTNHKPVGQSEPVGQPEPVGQSESVGLSEPVGQSKTCKHPRPRKTRVENGAKPKKRKRPSLRDNRNVRPKSDDVSSSDPSLTQILGPSLSELLATDTPLPDLENPVDDSAPSSLPQTASSPTMTSATSGGNTRATRKQPRLTAVKKQLETKMEENARLTNSLRLLEREIDNKNKIIEKFKKADSSQKLQIKQLSKGNDSLRREIASLELMAKSKPNDYSDIHEKCDNVKTCDTSDPADLKDQVVSAARSFLAAVGINDDDDFVNVQHRRHKPAIARTKVSLVPLSDGITPPPFPAEADKAVSPGHRRPSAPVLVRGQRPPPTPAGTLPPSGASPTNNTQDPSKPSIAIIGTSLVRGLAHRVSRQGFSATSFMYPGSELPVLRDRVPAIFSRNFKPNAVVLQCAGNDIANGHPVAQVVQQLDSLIHDIKIRCPDADIIVNKIPPRGHNHELLRNIEIVNNYISDMSKAKGSKVFSSDACPKSYRCYRKDEIHFNHKGKQLYAQEMLKVLNFPRLSFQLKR